MDPALTPSMTVPEVDAYLTGPGGFFETTVETVGENTFIQD